MTCQQWIRPICTGSVDFFKKLSKSTGRSMILKAFLIICVMLESEKSEVIKENMANNFTKGEQSSINLAEPSYVRGYECQCNLVKRNSDNLVIQCRLCANAIIERTLFVKFAHNAKVVSSWHMSDEYGCALGDFGKTLFRNISCTMQIQNNVVVLELFLERINHSVSYDEDTWMCVGEAEDFGKKKIYFSKSNDSPICPTKEQRSYLSNLGIQKEPKRVKKRETYSSPQSCLQFISCESDHEVTLLIINISCPRKVIEYCLGQPGNASRCCYQGTDDSMGLLNCTALISGPKKQEVPIKSSLSVLGKSLQLKVTFNDSNTDILNFTCNPSSPHDSYRNNSTANMTGNIATESESAHSCLVIGLSIGGVLLIAVVIIVCLVFRWIKKRGYKLLKFTNRAF